MEIQGVAGPDTAEQTSSEPKTQTELAEETKNQFLELLVTQLQHQDPFAPADSAQFTQQMMMMGQLEQLVNLNGSMQSMAAAQQGSLIAQYSDIVGKEVLATGDQFEIKEGDPGTIQFYLPENPSSVEINVFDGYGNLVRDFNPGITAGGSHTVAFDGKDSQGKDLKPGYYKYTVSALNKDSEGIMPTTYATGTISSIRLDNGTPIFQMGDTDVGVVDIQKIF